MGQSVAKTELKYRLIRVLKNVSKTELPQRDDNSLTAFYKLECKSIQMKLLNVLINRLL